jgi:hypothetical protein
MHEEKPTEPGGASLMRSKVAEYLRNEASWRAMKADEYPGTSEMLDVPKRSKPQRARWKACQMRIHGF